MPQRMINHRILHHPALALAGIWNGQTPHRVELCRAQLRFNRGFGGAGSHTQAFHRLHHTNLSSLQDRFLQGLLPS